MLKEYSGCHYMWTTLEKEKLATGIGDKTLLWAWDWEGQPWMQCLRGLAESKWRGCGSRSDVRDEWGDSLMWYSGLRPWVQRKMVLVRELERSCWGSYEFTKMVSLEGPCWVQGPPGKSDTGERSGWELCLSNSHWHWGRRSCIEDRKVKRRKPSAGH